MNFELFMHFDGTCRQAVEFYAKVFKSEVKNQMTYGQTPSTENYVVADSDKDRIMYCDVQIGDMTVMFSDMPTGHNLHIGNNISPTLSMNDKAEVSRIFNELKEGGEVYMDLQKTFYSELYGMVKDRYGIIWHVMHYDR